MKRIGLAIYSILPEVIYFYGIYTFEKINTWFKEDLLDILIFNSDNIMVLYE